MTLPFLSESVLIEEISYIVGGGSYPLGGATAGHFPFSAAYADGAALDYFATDSTNVEFASGTYNAGPNTITRGTIIASSNGGAPVTWSGKTRPLIRPIASGGGNNWFISFSVGGTFSSLTTDGWDSNYELFNVVAPATLTFPINFSTSPSPACEVAPVATAALTLQTIHSGTPTTVGTITIPAGLKVGSFSVATALSIPVGDS